MKSCPFCKEQVLDDAQKCRHCGSWMTGHDGRGSDGREKVVYIVDNDVVRFGKFALAILSLFALVGGFLYGCNVEKAAQKVSDAKEHALAAKEHAEKSRGQAEKIQKEVVSHQSEIEKVRKKIDQDAETALNILGQIRKYEGEAKSKLATFEKTQIPESQIERIVNRILATQLEGVLAPDQLAKLKAPVPARHPSLSELLDQPALATLKIREAAQTIVSAKPITIAILSDPVAIDLPQFQGRVRQDPQGDPAKILLGHGTAMTGLVAAIANTSTLLVISALNEHGAGSVSQITRALERAIENKVRVACIGFSTPDDDADMRSAIERAHQNGILLIAPAGINFDGERAIGYPAALKQVLSVGGSANDGQTRAHFSQYDSPVDLFAPALDIRVLNQNGSPEHMNGTSFAAAIVCGVAGLMLSARPALSPEQVRGLLKSSGMPLKSPGGGVGLDVFAAVSRALAFRK